jgi:hypothetical protein
MTPSDDQIVDAMITYGGSFTSQLGKAWRAADQHNREVLENAFSGYWREYREIATLKAERMSER